MIPVTLDAVADIVGGQLGDPAAGDRMVTGVSIDSRTVGEGTLFVALRGEHVDGHAFIEDALRRGAAGALALEGTQTGSTVTVDDPADALLGLGAWVRQTVDPRVIAVTGSSGKTTTKDLIRAALATQRRVVANVGSYNNELGVPLTCCELDTDTQVLVAEVGARGKGHIAAMAEVLHQDVAVVTNVGAAHLEMFTDIEGVARAKSELVETLHPDGVAILNVDDPLVAAMAGVAPGAVVTYGTGNDADLRATDIELDTLARASFSVADVRVSLGLPGRHNVANALAALAAAQACGVDLAAAAEGLTTAAVSRWRMEVLHSSAGVTVINDAYNANPSSMTAALQTLAAMTGDGRRWAILGHMAELGPGGADDHALVGRLCADLKLDGLLVVGEGATGIAEAATQAGFDGTLISAATPADAVGEARGLLRAGDIVLVKASRSVGLERVALALAQEGDA